MNVEQVVNRILEGADVRSTLSEFKVTVGDGEGAETFDIDPFKNKGKEYAKGAGPKGRPKGAVNKTNIFRMPDGAKTGATLAARIDAYNNLDFQGNGKKEPGIPYAIETDGANSKMVFKFADTEKDDVKKFVTDYLNKATNFHASWKYVENGDYAGEFTDAIVTVQKDTTLQAAAQLRLYSSDTIARFTSIKKSSGSYGAFVVSDRGRRDKVIDVVPGETVTFNFEYPVYVDQYWDEYKSYETFYTVSFVVPKNASGIADFEFGGYRGGNTPRISNSLNSGWAKKLLYKCSNPRE